MKWRELVHADVPAAVSAVREATDDLLDLPLVPYADDEIVDAMREVEAVRRQLDVVARQLAAEAQSRCLPQRSGSGKLSTFLRETLNLGRGEAAARAAAVDVLADTADPVSGVV
ncbi:hypothetical protein [Nocardia aurantiaca]|uniref:DUF222 domain-containing protein n=1 Tax=Nocardia aurantiaca TaxID=2675850 RepID=A0A6I3KZD5_9NOCA|nr:hypothetical protein [Nocardia aurantiaca]MTE15422.1 hypothetical protein [Nocardia aurantiaca]